MARFSIGRSINDGFALLMARPLSVFVWGAVLVAPTLIGLPLMWDMLASMPMADPESSDAAVQAMMSDMMEFQAAASLLNLLQLLAMPIAYAAIMRAVIRPKESSFFSLRLGMDELRIAVVGLAIGIGLYVGIIVLALLGVGVGFAVHMLGEAATVIAVIIMVIALIAVIILAMARVSLIAPASILHRDFAFEQGWRMAKGKTGALAGLMVLLFLIVLAIELVLGAVVLAVIFGAIAIGAGSGWSLPADPQLLGEVLPPLASAWPWLLGAAVVGSIFYGIVITLTVAPFASACRQLAEAAAEPSPVEPA